MLYWLVNLTVVVKLIIKLYFILAIRDQECLLPYIATMLIECESSTQLETLIEILSFGVNMSNFDGALVYSLVKTDISLSNVWNNINNLLR